MNSLISMLAPLASYVKPIEPYVEVLIAKVNVINGMLEPIGPLKYAVYAIVVFLFFVFLIMFYGAVIAGADHHGEAYAVLAVPLDEVWKHIHDISNLHVTGDQMQKMIIPKDQDPIVQWQEDMGDSIISVKIIEEEDEDDLKIIKRHLQDSVVPMKSEFVVRLFAVDDGNKTFVHAYQNVRVDWGTWHVPMFRFILSLGGATGSMTDYCKRLIKLCSGEGQMLRNEEVPDLDTLDEYDLTPIDDEDEKDDDEKKNQ